MTSYGSPPALSLSVGSLLPSWLWPALGSNRHAKGGNHQLRVEIDGKEKAGGEVPVGMEEATGTACWVTLSRASSPAAPGLWGSFLKPQVEQDLEPFRARRHQLSSHTGKDSGKKAACHRLMRYTFGMKTNESTCLCGSSLAFFPFEFTSPSCLPETSNHRKFFLWVKFSYRFLQVKFSSQCSTIFFLDLRWYSSDCYSLCQLDFFLLHKSRFHCQVWWVSPHLSTLQTSAPHPRY